MGLRHYARVNSHLPGKVGGMDIDWILEQSKTDRLLAIEFKPSRAPLQQGQRRTLHWFKRHKADVWIVNDGKFLRDGIVEVAVMEDDGFFRKWFGPMTEDQLGQRICAWWEWGLR
jgi:hypothetical protein